MLVGKLSIVHGSFIGLVGEPTEPVGRLSIVHGNLTGLVGTLTDLVDKRGDLVPQPTDLVPPLANLVGSLTGLVGRSGEFAQQYLKKGSCVYVEGGLKTDKSEDK